MSFEKKRKMSILISSAHSLPGRKAFLLWCSKRHPLWPDPEHMNPKLDYDEEEQTMSES